MVYPAIPAFGCPAGKGEEERRSNWNKAPVVHSRLLGGIAALSSPPLFADLDLPNLRNLLGIKPQRRYLLSPSAHH